MLGHWPKARQVPAAALRGALLRACAAASLWAALAGPATARPSEDPSSRSVEVAIGEQSLGSALQEFARQIGRQIIFFSGDANQLRAPAVSGRLTEREALRRLLDGSGLEAVYINERTIGVGRRDASGRFIHEGALSSRHPLARPGYDGSYGTPIIVTGRLLDAELSTDEKRTSAQIEDVITSDQTSQLPDKNIAETLARLPGISVIRNGETGDGAHVSIRGLDSALSNIQFNGVNSGQAHGLNRGVPLEGVTSDNVSEIRVAKSLLPSDEGSGIGGSVNIVSRTPLDGGENQLTLDASLRHAEFAAKSGFDAAATMTHLFGDTFGVNLAASFRRRFIHAFDIDAIHSHLAYIDGVVGPDGRMRSAAELDAMGLNAQNHWRNYTSGQFRPEQIVFEQHSYQVQEQRRDTLSLSGAIDWRPTPSTLITASGRYSGNTTHGMEWMLAFDEDGGPLTLRGDRLVATWNDLELDYEAQYERSEDLNAIAFLKGVTDTDRLTFSWQASYALARSENPQSDIVFNSATRFDRGRDPPLSYQPHTYTAEFFPVPAAGVLADPALAGALRNIPRAVELTGWRAYEITNRNDRYALRADLTVKTQIDLLGGTLSAVTLGAKAERSDIYNFFDYFQSTATHLNLDGSFNRSGPGDALGKTLGEFASLGLRTVGMEQIGSPLAAVGVEHIPRFGQSEWAAFNNRFQQTFLEAGVPYSQRDYFDGRENVYAAYGQFVFRSGDLQVIGGARLEHYEGAFATPVSVQGQIRLAAAGEPTRTLELTPLRSALTMVTTRSVNTEFLPRLALTYDVTPQVKLRFGATQSLARPTYAQLGNAASVSLVVEAQDASGVILPGVNDAAAAVAAGGLREDQIRTVALSVSSGNPDLPNAKSSNLDLSAEWYPARGSSITVGAFYKSIGNFIFLGAESTDATLDIAFVEALLSPDARALLQSVGGIANLAQDKFNPTLAIARPVAGERATLKGIEVAVNHRFDWLPGRLRHLGFHGHATHVDSGARFIVTEQLAAEEALVVLGFRQEGEPLVRRAPFFRAPRLSGAASLFYDDGTVDAALSTTYQSASFDTTDDFGLDQYTAAYQQLDFFVGYTFRLLDGRAKAFFEVADLLDGGRKATDLQTVGIERESYDEASFNGREFRLGIRSRF